jgi:hypothetical protein
MADVKISGLPASTVPLAGTEVLPIVQGGATKQVSVDNLTTGKSVSATSFVPSGATIPTNGIYLPSANSVGIATNTVERMRIDSSGNVGIGSSAPVAKLQVVGGVQPIRTLRDTGNGGLSSGDVGGAIGFGTSAGTGTGYIGAQIGITANSTWTAGTSQPTDITFENVPSGSTTLTERMRITAAGDVSLTTGNLVIGTSGKGIDFTATSGAGTSELLSDYEEGTFTPTANNFTVVGTPTYTGRYTKIGRVVFINIQATSTTSISSTVGSSNFSGLPFSAIQDSPAPVADSNNAASYGNGIVAGNILYAPTWGASGSVALSAMFQTA